MSTMLSIVIPSYNNASYLDRCLNSIVLQNYRNIEVIVVDDGSTDNTPEICEKYKSKYSNVVIIRKENGGVSSARNLGIANVKGDYVIFIDSDDYITEDALQIISDNIDEQSDLYIYNNLIIKEDGISECKNSNSFDSINEVILETVEATKDGENEWLRTIWAKVYRKEILNDVSFPKEVHIGQDACFFIDLLIYLGGIERIKVIPKAWYVYDRTNELSATHKYKRDMFLLSKLQFDHFIDKVKNLKNIDEKYRNTVLCKFCWKIFWILYFQGQNVSNNDNCFKWYQYTKEYICQKNINQINFDNEIMNRTFKFRRLLSNGLFSSIFKKYYLMRNSKNV